MNTPGIILIGMSGVGKSSVGKLLAKQLERPFVDTDKELCRLHHVGLRQLLDDLGDTAFMKAESDLFCDLDLDGKVVAPGGSIIYSEAAMAHARGAGAHIIYLKNNLENILRAVKNIDERGIVGLGTQRIEALYAQRVPLYEKYATLSLPCQASRYRQVCDAIREELGL